MTDIWLIRHGETDWNRAHRLQGGQDIPLNDNGQAQAHQLARRLAELPERPRFVGLYSSDLQRARQTAQPLTAVLDLPLLTETGLRERSFGVLEGLAIDTMAQTQPEAAAIWRERRLHDPLPGGESLADFARRVLDSLHLLAQRHDGNTLLAVTHGGVLNVVWQYAHGEPFDAPRSAVIRNAGINRIRIDGTRWHILGWGDTSHLDQAAADDASLPPASHPAPPIA